DRPAPPRSWRAAEPGGADDPRRLQRARYDEPATEPGRVVDVHHGRGPRGSRHLRLRPPRRISHVAISVDVEGNPTEVHDRDRLVRVPDRISRRQAAAAWSRVLAAARAARRAGDARQGARELPT